MDTGKQWRRGGSAKSIGEILKRLTHIVAPSTAARSGDGSVERVRAFMAGDIGLRQLGDMTSFAAVDRLLVVAGFADKMRNQRLLMARLLTSRIGRDSTRIVLLIISDIVCVDGAMSVGGCLAYRLRAIVEGRCREAFSRSPDENVLRRLREAFPQRLA